MDNYTRFCRFSTGFVVNIRSSILIDKKCILRFFVVLAVRVIAVLL